MAKPVVEALLKRDPWNSIGLTFQARMQIESGDVASALRTLEQASSEDGNYEARLEDARARFKLGEVELAGLKVGEALRLRPDFLPALLLTAQIQFKREDYRRVADTITRMLTIDPENREARLMNAVLRDGIGSGVGSRLLNPFLAEVVAKIASGRFQDAASLFEGSHAHGAQAYREMRAGLEATQDGAEGRFVYLRRSDCDDAVARNRELAMSPNDPFVLAKAVPGPWPAPEQTIPTFLLTP
jgi:tetratricopeptide (TPR) repeat protein